LFIDLLWSTGARVDDLCGLPISAVDFAKRQVKIEMKKTKRPTIVTLDADLLLDVSRFCSVFEVKEKLFGFSRVRAWKMIKTYAEQAGIADLHPHKFRHGLAIHLLQQGVPIPVISARLGHASVYVTMQMYMKVTPEIQAEMVKHVEWR
jgi:integrase/recombinase XerD